MTDEKDSARGFLAENAVVALLRDTYLAFSDRRDALGLPNPGTVDNIAREVQKEVLLNNYAFSGLRADLTKAFSVAPLFQVSHSFSMSAGGLPPYAFAVLYGSPKVRQAKTFRIHTLRQRTARLRCPQMRVTDSFCRFFCKVTSTTILR